MSLLGVHRLDCTDEVDAAGNMNNVGLIREDGADFRYTQRLLRLSLERLPLITPLLRLRDRQLPTFHPRRRRTNPHEQKRPNPHLSSHLLLQEVPLAALPLPIRPKAPLLNLSLADLATSRKQSLASHSFWAPWQVEEPPLPNRK